MTFINLSIVHDLRIAALQIKIREIKKIADILTHASIIRTLFYLTIPLSKELNKASI